MDDIDLDDIDFNDFFTQEQQKPSQKYNSNSSLDELFSDSKQFKSIKTNNGKIYA